MKSTIDTLLRIIVLGVSLISCSDINTSKTQETTEINLGKELLNADYLAFAYTSMLDTLNQEILNEFNIYNKATFKFCSIDAEELAEFNFEFFSKDLKNILSKRDFELNIFTPDGYDTSYTVSINGKEIQLYTKNDLNDYTFWEKAAKNFFQEINRQLNVKGIQEQFYLINGGNDLSTLLLTQKQFEIITNEYQNSPKYAPYLP